MAQRIRRSRSSGPKNNVWTVVLIDELVVAGTVIEANIVEDVNWTGANSYQRATILRTRGWISVAAAPGDVSFGNIFMGIYVADEDAAPVAPDTTLFYTDEDVLWTGGAQFGAVVAGGLEHRGSISWDIDIKAMRKIDTGRELRLAMIGTAALSLRLSAGLRSLVRKGGN